jgi:hypothetical protein
MAHWWTTFCEEENPTVLSPEVACEFAQWFASHAVQANEQYGDARRWWKQGRDAAAEEARSVSYGREQEWIQERIEERIRALQFSGDAVPSRAGGEVR